MEHPTPTTTPNTWETSTYSELSIFRTFVFWNISVFETRIRVLSMIWTKIRKVDISVRKDLHLYSWDSRLKTTEIHSFTNASVGALNLPDFVWKVRLWTRHYIVHNNQIWFSAMAQHWGTQLNANLPITFLAPQSYLCSKVSGNSFRFGIQKPWI